MDCVIPYCAANSFMIMQKSLVTLVAIGIFPSQARTQVHTTRDHSNEILQSCIMLVLIAHPSDQLLSMH